MIRQRVSLVAVGALVATAALTAGLATSASAASPPTIYDPSFIPDAGTDLVGVGSDTTEIVMHYLSEGHAGVAGFNFEKSSNRLASFAALSDTPTIVLRSGEAPVNRPNGSGNGKKTLYGPGNNVSVNFARSSSSLNTAEDSAGLRQFPFAVDGLKLAVSKTASNAPASISPAEMVKIYDGTYHVWGDIPGYAGPAPTALIKPYVPQSGSGTYSFFVAQLQAANSGVAVNISGNSETQEHSDVDVKDNPNAIVPFSTARAKTESAATVKVLAGFKAYRAIYNVARGADLSDATLGPKLTSVFGEGGFICSAAAKPLIEAAGFDQLARPVAGGACGVSRTTALSAFVTTSQVDTDTTLAAESINNNKVTLAASVDASTDPDGAVTFKDDGATIGAAVPVVDGKATKTLSLVALGDHHYSAEFTPSDILAFNASASPTETVTVKTASNVAVGLLNETGTYGTTRLVAISANVDGEAATGSVKVKVDSGNPSTVTLNRGVAFVSIPGTTVVGAHTVTATLAGTAVHSEASDSAPLVVTKAKTSTKFAFVDPTISAATTPKTITRVTIIGASATVKPSGTITFKYGSKTVGTGTVTNGVAKVSLARQKKKSTVYGIRATFTSSSSNYSGSISATVNLRVS
ncbi:Ig-like domain repeat protein [Aeromicrobium sp.]|uniref:Ig-like domain repeat protein n=1 Tax=Aeromicrobium sp. TaxID=1871063 RepID=UPI0019A5F07B|nr:Ig-like domain repeat protein [Aeromicrobium sp.]MBC7632221.1 Ig-like domain repeat protein [Aeromicrobium sp.]